MQRQRDHHDQGARDPQRYHRRAGLRDGEETLICSLFRNLGRMMCRLHFYEKSKQVEALIAELGMTEAAASRRVFGIAYDEFGQAIGRHWHLPANLLQGMAPLPPGSAKAVGGDVPKLQVMANLAHDVYVATRDSAPEATQAAYAELMKRYGPVVHLETAELEELVRQAGTAMEKEAATLQVDVRSSPMLARLLSRPEAAPEEAAVEAEAPPSAEETAAMTGEAAEDAHDPTAILITGMQDLTNLLLTFPQLSPQEFQPWVNPDDAARKGMSVPDYAAQQSAQWSKGLADWGQDGARIQKLRDAAEYVIYTPGSSAGGSGSSGSSRGTWRSMSPMREPLPTGSPWAKASRRCPSNTGPTA
mgnify:CR=1 FL=1